MREEEGNVCLCVCVGGLAGTKGKGTGVCKDLEGRDTRVCTCPSAIKRNMVFWGVGEEGTAQATGLM